MIAKIGKGENLIGALLYNQQKVDIEKGAVLLTSKIAESMDGHYNISHLNRYFEPYLIANKNTEKIVRHISLNPDPQDKVTDEQFRSMAQEYMEKMGYGNQPYIVYKHNDIDRTHIHIVTVCVDLKGDKISDSHDHPKSMVICRELERKFGLIPAIEKQQPDSAQNFRPVNCKEGGIKSQIASVVRNLPKYYHYSNLGTYNALLSLFNITAEKVIGELQGQQKNGLVYFALNENGGKASNPFKASKFGGYAGLTALEQHFTDSQEILKTSKSKDQIKRAVEIAMHTSKDEQSFKDQLVEQGINIVIRRNEAGRIYGVTFVDHQSRNVWNGSQLGKDLSANIFNDLWSDRITNPQEEKQPIKKRFNAPEKDLPADSVHNYFSFLEQSNPLTIDQFGLLDDLSGILPDVQGDDYEEMAFENRMKKRNKRFKKR
ncbi:conjugal transfer protein MobB [Sphingobacterium sp.]|uniref:conjugal transfer protein MobB n=1 Tax=Sphingobacterium sp. TaxID=341027 RepID=UPI0025891B45|nr:conjugal transfer protein MobB [Sphingobacterium sp.]WET69083.1 MAG: conjugal transfer protein MobB [Sphingobacterium sp.]